MILPADTSIRPRSPGSRVVRVSCCATLNPACRDSIPRSNHPSTPTASPVFLDPLPLLQSLVITVSANQLWCHILTNAKNYTRGAIYRRMHEYKREAATYSARLEELHKRSLYHDDHLRIVDAWWRQVSLPSALWNTMPYVLEALDRRTNIRTIAPARNRTYRYLNNV